MGRLVIMMTFGGFLLGVGWSLIYAIILFLTGFNMLLIHAVLYGMIFGTLLGLLNALLLIFMTNGKSYSNTTPFISTIIVTVPVFFMFLLLSPTLIYLFINVGVVVLGIYRLNQYILRKTM